MEESVQFFAPVRDAFNRRQMLKGAGGLLGAGAALAALAPSASADAGVDQIDGLWAGVVSPQDGHSFPPFKTIEIYGGSLWIASGNTDLTLGVLESSLWGVFTKIGPRTYRGVGRFWTYSSGFVNTGFGTFVQTVTLSADGKTYHGEGPSQFFDTNGVSLGPPTIILDDGVRIA